MLVIEVVVVVAVVVVELAVVGVAVVGEIALICAKSTTVMLLWYGLVGLMLLQPSLRILLMILLLSSLLLKLLRVVKLGLIVWRVLLSF